MYWAAAIVWNGSACVTQQRAIEEAEQKRLAEQAAEQNAKQAEKAAKQAENEQVAAQLCAIQMQCHAESQGVSLAEGWMSAGALFWVSLACAAWSVASAPRWVAVVLWAAFDVAAAISLSHTPNTTFLTELVWMGAISGGIQYQAAATVLTTTSAAAGSRRVIRRA